MNSTLYAKEIYPKLLEWIKELSGSDKTSVNLEKIPQLYSLVPKLPNIVYTLEVNSWSTNIETRFAQLDANSTQEEVDNVFNDIGILVKEKNRYKYQAAQWLWKKLNFNQNDKHWDNYHQYNGPHNYKLEDDWKTPK
jgi:hypothetical protein